MRATMFTVGLTLAASASVQAQDLSNSAAGDRLTLTNGCVYTQNQLTDGTEWSLVYTQAGTSVQCPLTIYGQRTQAPTPVTAPMLPPARVDDPVVTQHQQARIYTPPRRRISFDPKYIVGVFR